MSMTLDSIATDRQKSSYFSVPDQHGESERCFSPIHIHSSALCSAYSQLMFFVLEDFFSIWAGSLSEEKCEAGQLFRDWHLVRTDPCCEWEQ
jgi:hypothetical protein